jgi:DNA-binding transcriptional LysR family regulator
MDWSIDDVPVFVAVVEHNGITAAARYLEIPKSTVSTSLTRLEAGLGVRLVDRNSRNLRMTEDGEIFYRHAKQILEQVDETAAIMSGLTSVPSGRLVVALPMAFGREVVAPRLKLFKDRFPLVDLDIIITSHPVDVVRDRVDLAVVIGELHDSDVIVKPLCRGGLVWVASPDYARSHELTGGLDDLLGHIQICEKRYSDGRVPVRIGGHKRFLPIARSVIRVNDPTVVREAVILGCGVSFLPRRYCGAALEQGRLVEVFDTVHFDIEASTLSAVYPSKRLLSGRTRAFLDFLAEIV